MTARIQQQRPARPRRPVAAIEAAPPVHPVIGRRRAATEAYEHGSGSPDVDVNFTACPECGALIDVTVNGKSVLPEASDRHRRWHFSERERVADLMAVSRRLGYIR